ncbi:MAG: ACP phosphodiesterase [Microscillaceae bacterium]|nr:ACP phosphodiesterase [Microscillaceae bacterium]MDW8461461.1 ACP phosphodiesterase [Cytophagales bacterium]
MNYLAHAALSGEKEEILIGNFIADFVRGSQIGLYSDDIKQGIYLHRKIDMFADTHPYCKASSQLLQPNLGKYASVVVDVFYDHFLAVHWEKFNTQNLGDFAQKTYQILENHKEILPEKPQRILPYMQKQNWFLGYADIANIRHALMRLAQRAKYANNIAQATDLLEKYYHELEHHFLAFFPDIQAYVESEMPK